MTVHSQIQVCSEIIWGTLFDLTSLLLIFNQFKCKPSYFNSPPLDVSVAFPQATPASTFPPLASDYYQFDDLLSPEERALRKKVRECMEKKATNLKFFPQYWEKAEFPFQIVPKLGALRISGGTIKGYGCPGLSLTGSAIAMAEVARVMQVAQLLVHSSLAMLTLVRSMIHVNNQHFSLYISSNFWYYFFLSIIALCGSEEQKQKYLPSLAQLKTVACWALTEPDYGSDASSLKTTATKRGVLEGQKRWIGNSLLQMCWLSFQEYYNQPDKRVIKKDSPGLTATKIPNKIGLRIVQNGDILLKKVFVLDEDRLPGVNSFQDTSKVLAVSRVMVAWQPIGISMGVYDMCARYAMNSSPETVWAPLAAFQINQQKLARMLGNIQAMTLVGWRLCKLYEEGKMTPGHASLGKSWITSMARETAARRELLGGNGILAAFCDLEPIYTYEGYYDINSLVTGREITGFARF
ncbi:hypothetical protein E1A91_D09G186700v1 [Gossypium mustelinum]|uniref:Uncharacterized protein n=1 Tax=Gossypium mustelinum TaxID=34275 RepID=A0A5D2TL30_GOSMU|nr:hypothetical protein E1A91_D09G186700v1 [Gossypium mustelinum]